MLRSWKVPLRLTRCFATTAKWNQMTELSVTGSVAVIKLQNPPRNIMCQELRAGIVDSIKKANENSSVRSIVLHGDGEVLSGGADISELQTGRVHADPDLLEMAETIESSSKPVVAAIHGVAYGAGLLLALGSHYRLMDYKARVSFPEVHVGLIPASSASQRLSRVTNIATAVEMCSTGMPLSAKKALENGIVDKVVEGDILAEAIIFAESVEGEPIEPRRVSKMKVDKDGYNPAFFEAACDKVSKRARGDITPMLNVKAIEAAVNSASYEEGLQKELELVLALFPAEQSRALQYVYFSERKLLKWETPGGEVSYKNTTPKVVKEGAVIGGGTMGSGIAICFITNGIPVKLVEANQESLDKTLSGIKKIIQRNVDTGRISQVKADQHLLLLQGTLDYNDLKGSDIVIEAVYESMDLKKQIFERLDQICKPEAILASNTSGLNIDELADMTSRPDKVVGTHFFSPAHIMKLLENVRGRQTSPETMATVMELGKNLQKISVLVGNCPHFVGNRMLEPYGLESCYLLEEGALPHEVDQVMEDLGFAMGIFKVADLAGNDVGYKSRKDFGFITSDGQQDRFRLGRRYCPISDYLVEKGRFGQKVGKGFYDYGKPGGRVPQPDPEVEQLIIEESKRAGIKRRRKPPQEILERCLYPLINEGFKILEEGIASREEDIDMIWLYGYGWPRHTGGPMHYARNSVGLGKIYKRLHYYQALHPTVPHWKPSKLLASEACKNEGVIYSLSNR
ncbi:peroxisomal bifunctional enzyme-like [Apostichopus japonicus]|uniref:peroxisomal bifunctional enzyme-like n=1 Tax=Stichopus japonicus TaxID=307972 RepID=UPI003AB74087